MDCYYRMFMKYHFHLIFMKLFILKKVLYFVITYLFLINIVQANTTEQLNSAADFADSVERQQREKAQQREFEEAIADPKKPIQLPEIEPLPDFTEEDVCFSIKNIEVSGLLSDWIRNAGVAYIDECVGHQSISAFVRQINQQLLYKGYVTSRAILPEQDLSLGILTILVQEGKVESIVFPDDYEKFWKNAIPITVGGVLNMRDLEQGIDQLNRLASQNIELKIEPGNEHGASKIVAYITPSKPWHYNLYIDDSGSDSTGSYPLATTLTLDNSLKIQDIFTYSTSLAADTNDTKGSTSETFSLSIPLGYWLLKLSANQFASYQALVTETQIFETSSIGHDEEANLDHVLFRDNKTKLSWSVGIKKRTRRSFLSDAEFENQRRNLTHIELAGNYRRYLQNAVLNISLNMKQGVDLLNAEKTDPDSTVQPDFRLYGMSAAYNMPVNLFDKDLNFASQFTLQQAASELYSLDWFSNGSRYTVRGFSSDESLAAAQGWRLKNDLTIPMSIKEYPISSYIGWDFGVVSGKGTEKIDDTSLMGITLGAKGKLYDIDYDVFIARPFLLYGPEAKDSCCEAGFSLSVSF